MPALICLIWGRERCEELWNKKMKTSRCLPSQSTQSTTYEKCSKISLCGSNTQPPAVPDIKKHLKTSLLYQSFYPRMPFNAICTQLFMQNMTSNTLTPSGFSVTDKPLNGHNLETDSQKVSHLPLLLNSHWMEQSDRSGVCMCVCVCVSCVIGLVWLGAKDLRFKLRKAFEPQ